MVDKGMFKPVAWRWLYNGKPHGNQSFPLPPPDPDIVARAAAAEFPRTIQILWGLDEDTAVSGRQRRPSENEAKDD